MQLSLAQIEGSMAAIVTRDTTITANMSTRKPWAIDRKYFSTCIDGDAIIIGPRKQR